MRACEAEIVTIKQQINRKYTININTQCKYKWG